MSLFTSTMLQAWIKDLIINVRTGQGNLSCSGGIMLMTNPDMLLSPEYLYIGEADTISEFLLQNPDIQPGTFLISAGDLCLLPDSVSENLTIIETNCFPFITGFMNICTAFASGTKSCIISYIQMADCKSFWNTPTRNFMPRSCF